MKRIFSNLWGAFKEVFGYIKEPALLSVLFAVLLSLILNVFSGDMTGVIIDFFFTMLIAKILLGVGVK